MIQLREYQKQIAEQARIKLLEYGIVYLAMGMRTGKTLTSLYACHLLLKDIPANVLFVTKKKVINDIIEQSKGLKVKYSLDVINYESLHKLDNKYYDVIICDEAHCIGAFPKPSLRHKTLREMLVGKYTRLIMLSGTPTPESYSQIYHQLNVSDMYKVFHYDNFYKWSKVFVNVKQRKGANGFMYNDYSDARKNDIKKIIDKYFITYSQEQSGFEVGVNEIIHNVPMSDLTYKLTTQLRKDRVINGKAGTILADTGVKLMNKLHQLYSGSCILENGETVILDRAKINYIKENFNGRKIAVFYKFKAELELLKEGFPNYTESFDEFNVSNDKFFLGQILSTREGVNLSTADDLIFYNIDYSATSYLQCKERAMTKDRVTPANVHFIFSNDGLEKKIYKVLQDKKDYTLSYFLKDEGLKEIQPTLL